MATKTFKIGERCQGGVITAVTSKTSITIIAKEWDNSAGFGKGSNQSNAKAFNRLEVEIADENAYRKLSQFLNELTTSYYSDEVLNWCESKSELNKKFFW